MDFLRHKNLYKLYLSEFFWGLYFAIPIQALFYTAKGLSFSEIMWLESILFIAIMMFEIPTGIFGDKIGRKWSRISGTLLLIISWIPWFMADQDFFLYALAFFITGIGIAFFSGSEEAFVYDELKQHGEESKMQKYYGYYIGARKIGFIISSLVGGFLAVRGDMGTFLLLFKLSVLAELVSLVIAFFIKEPKRTPEGEKKEHGPDQPFMLFKNGLKLLKQNPKLRRIALLSIFSTPFMVVMTYAFQPYFQHSNVPMAWFGIALAVASVISLASTIFAQKIEHWFGVEKGMLIVTLAPAFLWIIMGLIFSPVWAVVLFILHEGFSNFRDPIFTDYQNRHIESYNRATVLSTISLIGGFFYMIMRPIFGYLIDINLSLGFVAIGAVIIIGSIAFRIQHKHTVIFESNDI